MNCLYLRLGFSRSENSHAKHNYRVPGHFYGARLATLCCRMCEIIENALNPSWLGIQLCKEFRNSLPHLRLCVEQCSIKLQLPTSFDTTINWKNEERWEFRTRFCTRKSCRNPTVLIQPRARRMEDQLHLHLLKLILFNQRHFGTLLTMLMK